MRRHDIGGRNFPSHGQEKAAEAVKRRHQEGLVQPSYMELVMEALTQEGETQ
jgi:hypothetical protein